MAARSARAAGGGASALLNIRRVQLVQLSAFHRLPATYGLREAAEAGGLMAYGPSILEGYWHLNWWRLHIVARIRSVIIVTSLGGTSSVTFNRDRKREPYLRGMRQP